MKTIIIIGIALLLGVSVNAQNWNATYGQTDRIAFDPGSMMRAVPINTDGLIKMRLVTEVSFHMWPGDIRTNDPRLEKVRYIHGNADALPKPPLSFPVAPDNCPNKD